MSRRPRVAVVDYEVTETSPSGSVHLRLLEQLHDEADFTVVASAFDNPAPARIRYVRAPSVPRPLAARYPTFAVTSAAALRRAGRQLPFDVVQAVEGYTPFCDVSYVHFCHLAYLRSRAAEERRGQDLRGQIRLLDHRLRALDEGRALRRPRLIVVPSPGLRDDLERVHGVHRDKVRVIGNPVDVLRWRPPTDAGHEERRAAQRARLDAGPDDLLVAFVALGHFERKGLPQALEALRSCDERVRLVVVGGEQDTVAAYRGGAAAAGVSRRVSFVGRQADVRPYLWAADAFLSPSSYETFSLTAHQAAAAGLPLLVTTAGGGAAFFREAEHGFSVSRDPLVIASRLERTRALTQAQRRAMGDAARRAVEPLTVAAFADAWREVYRELVAEAREGRAGRRAAGA